LLLDNTDRNRTSPFAFTGNKFEFRAVGSSANCAGPMTVLNTIMTETLVQFKKSVDGLIEQGEKKEVAIMQVIQKYIVESKPVLFEGDGYSEAWEKEAEKRGLANIKTTPLALDAFVNSKAKNLFTKHNIYTEAELEARHEILLENYTKKIQIEARVMGDMASTYVLPPAIKYQNLLLENIKGLKEMGFKAEDYNAQKQMVAKLSEHINVISTNVKDMIQSRKKANDLPNHRDKAIEYCDHVKSYFDKIRYHADKLELLVDDELWELPKYRELLFLR
jgi:glutamine synthetase